MAKEVTQDIMPADDMPQVVNADLRKFNRSEQIVAAAITSLKMITAFETAAGYEAAMLVLKDAKTVENKIEAKRKELVKPFNDASKKINDYAKKLIDQLPAEVDRVKKEVVAFQKREDERVRRERYEARVVQLKNIGFVFDDDAKQWTILDNITILDDFILYADGESWTPFLSDKVFYINQKRNQQHQQTVETAEDDLMFGTDDDTEVIEAPAPAMVTVYDAVPVQEATKVKGITKRWTFEVTNLKELPIDYVQANDKAIREAIGKGVRLIPGVRIYQDESLTIR